MVSSCDTGVYASRGYCNLFEMDCQPLGVPLHEYQGDSLQPAQGARLAAPSVKTAGDIRKKYIAYDVVMAGPNYLS